VEEFKGVKISHELLKSDSIENNILQLKESTTLDYEIHNSNEKKADYSDIKIYKREIVASEIFIIR
jgi:hypothetical protein